MSIKQAAQIVRSQGRGNDSMLIHITPKEVGGLQALAQQHGGSLTINPETGLPEAGFLESILPTVIGLGITAATGGAAAPWMVGAGVGGATALATGDIEKGLMAGLGAYGGAGIGSSISSMGAAANAGAGAGAANAAKAGAMNPAMIESGTSGLAGAAMEQGALGASNYGTAASNFGAGLGEVAKAPMDFAMSNAGNLAMGLGPAVAGMADQNNQEPPDQGDIREYEYSREINPNFGMPGQSYYTESFTPTGVTPAESFEGFADGGIAQLQGPYKPNIQTPDAAVTQYNNTLMQRANKEYNQTPQLGAFQSALPNQGVYNPQAGAAFQARQAEIQKQFENSGPNQWGYQFDPMTNRVIQTNPADEEKKAQEEAKTFEEVFFDNLMNRDQYQDRYAQGGITALAQGGSTLGSYSDGGRLLKGPGDGVSDNIPATIEGDRPARLADGEFVLPARIVSEIGNGSTDAGAKRLYAMMNRIEQRRRQSMGNDNISVDTKAYQELPR